VQVDTAYLSFYWVVGCVFSTAAGNSSECAPDRLLLMLPPALSLYSQTAGAEQAPLVQKLLQDLQAPSDSDSPGNAAAAAAAAAAFRDSTVHDDCYGVPRFVSAIRTDS
jgi:hypothetical protein